MFQSQKYTDLSCQNGDLELVFLIDSSGSTRANGDFFRASKDWISGFLKFFNLENLKVGLVSFAEDARVVLPLRNLPIQRVEKRLKSIFAQEYWFYLSCFLQIWNYFILYYIIPVEIFVILTIVIIANIVMAKAYKYACKHPLERCTICNISRVIAKTWKYAFKHPLQRCTMSIIALGRFWPLEFQ